jgi:hypothetical protein
MSSYYYECEDNEMEIIASYAGNDEEKVKYRKIDVILGGELVKTRITP